MDVGFYGVVTCGCGVLWVSAPWMWGSMGRCPLAVRLYGSVPPGCGALWGDAPWMWGSMGRPHPEVPPLSTPAGGEAVGSVRLGGRGRSLHLLQDLRRHHAHLRGRRVPGALPEHGPAVRPGGGPGAACRPGLHHLVLPAAPVRGGRPWRGGGEALPIEIKALPAVSACVRLWGGLWLGAIRPSRPAPSTDAPRLQERPLRDLPPPPGTGTPPAPLRLSLRKRHRPAISSSG